jgi:hypothetical protein
LKDKKYFFVSYDEEPELQKIVEEIALDLFGEHSFIFPKSKLMSKKAELGTIPDGFILDISDPDNPILYVLEVELRSHGLEHIATQILKFAISYRESRPKLNVFLKEIIRADSNLEKKIEDRLTESKKFKYLDQLIDSAMDEDIPTVIVPIDGLDESLKQVQNYINVPIRYLPIETYINRETGETVHRFKPLYQEEEAAIPTEVGTFYRFLLDDVEIIDIPRSKFDEEHNISKHTQGYTFIRDANGEPTGVVFWWYRNRMERHIKEDVTADKKTWAGTARPVDPTSYKIDMDVYIGETIWDGDTGEKVDDPKYRIKGKLKEIYRIDGEKKTKIFP